MQTDNIDVSAEYYLEVTVCNAVGCRDNRDAISFAGYWGFPTGRLTARPTQMTVDDVYLTAFYGIDPPSGAFNSGGLTATGVEIRANLRDPILDFGNITSFVWETRQIDPDFVGFVSLNGTASGGTDTVVGSWPGYSTHSGGNNAGQDLQWEVRAAAINAAGQGPWSDWATLTPPAPAPTANLVNSGIGCTLGSGAKPGEECLLAGL